MFSEFNEVLKSAGIPSDWSDLMGQREVSRMTVSSIGNSEGLKQSRITGIAMRNPTSGNVVRL